MGWDPIGGWCLSTSSNDPDGLYGSTLMDLFVLPAGSSLPVVGKAPWGIPGIGLKRIVGRVGRYPIVYTYMRSWLSNIFNPLQEIKGVQEVVFRYSREVLRTKTSSPVEVVDIGFFFVFWGEKLFKHFGQVDPDIIRRSGIRWGEISRSSRCSLDGSPFLPSIWN